MPVISKISYLEWLAYELSLPEGRMKMFDYKDLCAKKCCSLPLYMFYQVPKLY